MKRIYLDNAATTPIGDKARQEMKRVMEEIYGNPSSIHAEGRIAKTLIENARKVVANTIGASIGEIFFTSCGTESNNMVLNGAVRDLGVKRIISSPVEHHCVLHTLDYIQMQYGTEIIYLEVNKTAQPDLSQLENLLQSSTEKTLVTLMHANNEVGTLTDLQKVGELCKTYNALFHTDTTQTIGHLPIDVNTSFTHFLTGSAHKFYGPKGIGFVYINADHQIKPFIYGGAQERNMRAGTENVIGIAGLAAALEEINIHREEWYSMLLELKKYFKTTLTNSFNDIYFNGNQEDLFFPKILSISFPPSAKNELLLLNLDIDGISASGGSACSSGVETKSGVLDFIGEPADRKTVRFSFSHMNTKEEIDFTIEKLKGIFPNLIKEKV